MFSSSNEKPLHHAVGHTRPRPQVPENAHDRRVYTNTPGKQPLRQHSETYHATRGDSNARSERSAAISTLPVSLQQWLDQTDSDNEEGDNPPRTVGRNFVDSDNRHASTAGKPFDPNDLVEYEARTFAQKYLNLDYETSELANATAEAEMGLPPASSGTSTKFTTIFEGTGLSRETERTSLSLADPTKFPQYFNPKGYAREHELRRLGKKLRARLAERLGTEAIYGIKNTEPEKGRGERKAKAKEVKTENSSPIFAFSGEIHGRTIYNP